MKQLKNNKLLLVAGLGLASMQIASAAPPGGGSTAVSTVILMGYNDFDGTANNETPDDIASGLQSLVGKAVASNNTGGSSDGQYGNSTATSTFGNSPNGYLNLGTNGTTFLLNNTTGNDYTLSTLLFDSFRADNSAIGSMSVVYGFYGDENPTGTGSFTVEKGANDNSNFTDFSINLGLTLHAGQTFVAMFYSPDTFVLLDNVAITGNEGAASISAVPEPGSLVALGGVLASGLALRSRRRSVKTA